MNSETATYTIGVIGFARAERRFLRRVVSLAASCQPSFKPFDKSSGGCPHLIMVDADRLDAMHSWHKFRRANAHHASFSPIFVGGTPAELPCPQPYMLQRPILSRDLFTVLERAVTEVHGFRATPEEIFSTQRPPGINALVVDDSLPVRVQMRGALSSIASRVDFAETGGRALELIEVNRYSVIFLNATLPDEDAHDLTGRIKRHPLQQHAVVVMLTTSASPADRVMGLLAGFDNFLLKPIRPDTFHEQAAEILRPAAAV